MRKIDPLFSHVNLQMKIDKVNRWGVKVGLDKVLTAPSIKVNTYDELVRHNAQILHFNRNTTIFYRGQRNDWNVDGKTVLLPSIFRKAAGEKNLQLKERFRILEEKSKLLRKKVSSRRPGLSGTALLNRFPEIAWSIIQHYQIYPTTVLDISHSLHVACSFAFDGNRGPTGVVYVLGTPWANDAIAYNTFEEIFNIRLLSISPPQAQRPFFQEGYLTGHFPFHKIDDPQKIDQSDLARRLIAKFEIPIDDSFWGKDFRAIPMINFIPQKI